MKYIVAFFIIFSPIVHAAIPLDYTNDLSKMLDESDLIFQGEVSNIEYRLSADSDGSIPGSFSFVTFKVMNIFKGEYKEKLLTLRFYGGLDNATGSISGVDGIPVFDKSETDILFVKNNNVWECPLVSCEMGRFRVVKGKLYSEEGQEIQITNGRINRGSTHHSLAASVNDYGGYKLYKVIESEIESDDVIDRKSKAMTVGRFVSIIKQSTPKSGNVFKSSNPDAPFSSGVFRVQSSQNPVVPSGNATPSPVGGSEL